MVEEYRNSIGVMLRVLIEVALWDYIATKRLEKDVLDALDPTRRRRKHNPDWLPSLRDTLSYACDQRIFDGMNAGGYKATRALVSKDADHILTIDGFNAFVHGAYTIPTGGDLRALWHRASPMLELTLN